MVEVPGAARPVVVEKNAPFRYQSYPAPAAPAPVLLLVNDTTVAPGPQIRVCEGAKDEFIFPQFAKMLVVPAKQNNNAMKPTRKISLKDLCRKVEIILSNKMMLFSI
jgi:hypothetical protein